MVPKFRVYDTKNKVMVTNFHRSHMKIETGKVLYQLTTTNGTENKKVLGNNIRNIVIDEVHEYGPYFDK